jgi:hypothetical protein
LMHQCDLDGVDVCKVVVRIHRTHETASVLAPCYRVQGGDREAAIHPT